jgi:hypothetical protein
VGARPGGLHGAGQGKRNVQELIGVLFALRLLDYEARGQQEYQWQADDGFRHYVSLLIELSYEPSDIERELLTTWASGGEAVEDEGGHTPASQREGGPAEGATVTP